MASEEQLRRSVVIGGIGIAAAIVALAVLVGAPPRGSRPPPPAAPTPAPATAGLPPAPPSAPIAPSFDVVKVAPDRTAVIAGRAAPGAKVTVFDGATALGAVDADRRGEWVLLPPAPLAPGDRQLRLEATKPGGDTIKSQQSVALSIAPPGATGRAATPLAVALPDTAGPARLLQHPGGPAPGLALDAIDYDGKGGLALSGRAAPGARIEIYRDNRPVAEARADAAGRWSASLPATVAAGEPELRLDEIGADGRVSRRVAMPLVQALARHAAPGEPYIVRAGNNLWQIARHSYGSGLRYTIIYSANLQQIRNPDLIYPGQVFRLPAP